MDENSQSILQYLLSAPRGRVVAVIGADVKIIREQIECAENAADSSFVFFHQPGTYSPAEKIIDHALDGLADITLSCWPFWYSENDFSTYQDNTLGRESAQIQLGRIAENEPAISRNWALAALALAERGLMPRVPGIAREVEIAQLWRTIRPRGVVLAFAISRLPSNDEAVSLVQALEWIARHSGLGVVALLPRKVPDGSPLERILYGAQIIDGASDSASAFPGEMSGSADGLWVGPIRGRPHPLSPAEQRIAKLLARDEELAPLFAFNQLVDATHGKRYRVDLIWRIGQLIVEIDGYTDHSTRTQFAADRHRDYELLLSGYTVLRLTSEEIVQDTEKAIEKIRDIIRLRRTQKSWG